MPTHSRTARPARLALADGTIFHGLAFGATNITKVAEVVFNTALTGYQEILTDPSYSRQIVTLTYPHIGNTGTNAEDHEAAQVYSSGLIIRDLPLDLAETELDDPLGLLRGKVRASLDSAQRWERGKAAPARRAWFGIPSVPDISRLTSVAGERSFHLARNVMHARPITCRHLGS